MLLEEEKLTFPANDRQFERNLKNNQQAWSQNEDIASEFLGKGLVPDFGISLRIHNSSILPSDASALMVERGDSKKEVENRQNPLMNFKAEIKSPSTEFHEETNCFCSLFPELHSKNQKNSVKEMGTHEQTNSEHRTSKVSKDERMSILASKPARQERNRDMEEYKPVGLGHTSGIYSGLLWAAYLLCLLLSGVQSPYPATSVVTVSANTAALLGIHTSTRLSIALPPLKTTSFLAVHAALITCTSYQNGAGQSRSLPRI
jgi:chromatin remodeling complex protein RSC6